MGAERRISDRVKFGHAVSMSIVGEGGKWRRSCIMEDVSDTGAKLTVEGSLGGLDLKTFTLLLTAVGQAQRHCEMVWQKGNQIGVRFVKLAAQPRV